MIDDSVQTDADLSSSALSHCVTFQIREQTFTTRKKVMSPLTHTAVFTAIMQLNASALRKIFLVIVGNFRGN